jgi:ribosomal-protein-alanine N-acetyltransferase
MTGMKLESFSLRPATTEDLAAVLKIENEVHVAPWTEDHFRTELTKPYSQFLVLTDDETDIIVAGYLVCWVMFDECQVLNVATSLSYRGLGFAKQMIHKVVSTAVKKEIKKVVLEVRKSNVAAIQLYQRLNFNITHVRKAFYSDGEDAYQMILNLEGEILPIL